MMMHLSSSTERVEAGEDGTILLPWLNIKTRRPRMEGAIMSILVLTPVTKDFPQESAML
jgi:hypothetical protein